MGGCGLFCLVWFCLSCLVLSSLVLSCLVLSCLVWSRLVLSCFVLSCPRPVLSCLVWSCLVLSCVGLSCRVLFGFVPSRLVLSGLVLASGCLSCLGVAVFFSQTLCIFLFVSRYQRSGRAKGAGGGRGRVVPGRTMRMSLRRGQEIAAAVPSRARPGACSGRGSQSPLGAC